MLVEGVVVRGDGVAGRLYQMPTANIVLESALPIPNGVYAGYVTAPEAGLHQKLSVICYGAGQQRGMPKFEVHVLDWVGQLEGIMMRVELVRSVSALVPYEDFEQMRRKMHDDVVRVRAFGSEHEADVVDQSPLCTRDSFSTRERSKKFSAPGKVID